jgi:hypothetical protein
MPEDIPCVAGMGSGHRTVYWDAPEQKMVWDTQLVKDHMEPHVWFW